VDKQTRTTTATKKYVDNGYLIWFARRGGMGAPWKMAEMDRTSQSTSEEKPPRRTSRQQGNEIESGMGPEAAARPLRIEFRPRRMERWSLNKPPVCNTVK
jgi:hypothetical protein